MAANPLIFFSDLDGGPRTGGERGGGVWVTLYGRNFGASQEFSRVMVGPTPATEYKFWTNTKIAFLLPPATPTGRQNISISAAGSTSNSVPFNVRSTGGIYCVSTTGKDSNNGTIAGGCWSSVQHAVNVVGAGDTVYIRQGVVEQTPVSSNGSVSIGVERPVSGRADQAIAIVGYPGETAQIGGTGAGPCDSTTCIEGLFTYGNEQTYSYFTIANLTLRGNNTAAALTGRTTPSPPRSSNWRVIGNDISCPYGNGAAGCFETSEVDNVRFLGNTVHDVGWTSASTLYQAVYFSSDSSHIEVGWNTISQVNGCYGIQFHSSPLLGGGPSDPTGHQQFDLSVHDNIINDTQCSGIMFATVDPSHGKVEAYNNVIVNAGRGPGTGGGSFFCIDFPGYVNQPPAGDGTADVYNNTLYNCGAETARSRLEAGWGGAISSQGPANGQSGLRVHMRNNIVVQPKRGEYYWSIAAQTDCSSSCGNIYGTNNLFFGLDGNGPLHELANPNIVNTLRADPLFSNAPGGDFHLQGRSPARSAGVDTGLAYDIEGVSRIGRSSDLGAYSVAGKRLTGADCSPRSIKTPGSSTCVIHLTSDPADSAAIQVASDNLNLKAPPSVLAPSDAEAVSITPQANAVTAVQTATLSFTLNSDSLPFAVTLVPPFATFIDRVTNAAALQGGDVSPGQISAIFGFGLGPEIGVGGSLDVNGRIATSLAGTVVRFDGVPAPLIWVQANQINFVVPFAVGARAVTQIQVEANGLKSDPVLLNVAASSPAVFTLDATGAGQAAVINENGTLNGRGNPAARRSIIALWVTGLGMTDPPLVDGDLNSAQSMVRLLADVNVQIDQQTAEVAYLGPAPFEVAGLFQINAWVPQQVTPGDAVPVSVKAGKSWSRPGVTIAVK